MKALLVLDMQKHILSQKNFMEEKNKIKNIIKIFKNKGEKVLFTKHIEKEEGSPFNKNSDRSEIHEDFREYCDYIIEKTTPSAFFNTDLDDILKKEKIDEVVIVGFNTEFCCMFTAIAAFDRGYKVTFIEDATGTINNSEIYDMEGLDIKDLVGSVLSWSRCVDTLYYDEFTMNEEIVEEV